MKCPNCGTELHSEAYRKLRPGHHGPQICYYCPNGDFGTDYTHPTRAIAEIESAYKWNEQREGDAVGRMICTKEAREKCELAYMCEENAEVADDSECADLIVELEVKKLDESIHRQRQER